MGMLLKWSWIQQQNVQVQSLMAHSRSRPCSQQNPKYWKVTPNCNPWRIDWCTWEWWKWALKVLQHMRTKCKRRSLGSQVCLCISNMRILTCSRSVTIGVVMVSCTAKPLKWIRKIQSAMITPIKFGGWCSNAFSNVTFTYNLEVIGLQCQDFHLWQALQLFPEVVYLHLDSITSKIQIFVQQQIYVWQNLLVFHHLLVDLAPQWPHHQSLI